MAQPHLITTEKNEQAPQQRVLIIDKKGVLGSQLAATLSETAAVVYVSKTPPQGFFDELLYVPYSKKIPQIPNYYFHYQFVFLHDKAEFADLLPDILTKGKLEKTHVVVVAHYSLLSQKQIDKIHQTNREASVVLVGDVFPQNPFLGEQSSVSRLFVQAEKGRILLSQSGIRTSYPISESDVISGILTVVFSFHQKSKVFYLFPQEAITDMSIARALKKKNQDILIDFSWRSAQLPKEKEPLVLGGEYLVPPHYPLSEKILEAELRVKSEPEAASKNVWQKNAKSFWQTLVCVLLFVIFLVLIPIGTVFGSASFGVMELRNAKNSLLGGQLEVAEQSAGRAVFWFQLADRTTRILHAEFTLVGLQSAIEPWQAYIVLGRELSVATKESLQVLGDVGKMLGGKKKYSKAQFAQMLGILKSNVELVKKEQLSLAQKQLDTPYFGSELEQYEKAFSLMSSFSGVLPYVLGFETPQQYLVLMQNNMELRPGGGFIGSYGLLSLDRGRVTNFSIHDVYDADGQLKGHIEPPFALRRHIPVVHWYLRDSNFDLDFRNVASSAAKLFKEETGQQVDGVIGVDVSFMQQLVKVLGSVSVPDYNEKVTADNFYQKTQSRVEKNFFPGSTQKKDFLNALFRAVQLEFQTRKNISYATLLDTVLDAAAQKHILVAFADTGVQQLATANKISSSLFDEREQSVFKINDFLSIIDANVGSNKANYFVKRTLKQNVSLGEKGEITENVVLTYTNASKPNTWPGGDYKDYVRVIVPVGTTLQKVEIDSVAQTLVPAVTDPLVYEKPKFVAPKGLEIEIATESAKTSFGFLLVVPAQSSKTASITYSLSQTVPATPVVSYSLRLFKQPGTLSEPYSFSLSYPTSLRFLEAESQIIKSSEFKKGKQKIEVSMPLSQDTDLQLRFSQEIK